MSLTSRHLGPQTLLEPQPLLDRHLAIGGVPPDFAGDTRPLGPADVARAAAWLSGRVRPTPVLRSELLDRVLGARLWLKAEHVQVTGSYKARGALLAVGAIAARPGCPGVLAQSTGNHGVAVAAAAQRYGLPATVVVPDDAPAIKVARARAAGATVVLGGRSSDERAIEVEALRAATGRAVVDGAEDPLVVLGLGSASWELMAQVQQAGRSLDALVVPVGVGSGLAGACLAVPSRSAGGTTAVYGVEPLGCDAMARSLAAGHRVAVPPVATLADGLTPARVGALPYAIAHSSVAGVAVVDDADIREAFGLVLLTTGALVEPSAAAAVAGALALAAGGGLRDVGVMLTGGNLEPAAVDELLGGQGGERAHRRLRHAEGWAA